MGPDPGALLGEDIPANSDPILIRFGLGANIGLKTISFDLLWLLFDLLESKPTDSESFYLLCLSTIWVKFGKWTTSTLLLSGSFPAPALLLPCSSPAPASALPLPFFCPAPFKLL